MSQQARRRNRVRAWTRAVRTAAGEDWTAESPVVGSVAVAITYFYDRDPLDVDNIPKPILDALKGLVYSDDSQVSDLLCRKRALSEEPGIENASPALLEFLGHAEPVLHIAVTEAITGEVVL